MATKRARKEEIDTHPKRVQNPYAHLKRSPGKFDQRVFKEQELCSSNNVRFYHNLYTTQERAQLHRFDKNMAELKRRSQELQEKNEEYSYLRSLRTALHKEKKKRDDGAQTARPVTPEDVRRRLRIQQRSTMFALETERKKKKAAEAVAEKQSSLEQKPEVDQSVQQPLGEPASAGANPTVPTEAVSNPQTTTESSNNNQTDSLVASLEDVVITETVNPTTAAEPPAEEEEAPDDEDGDTPRSDNSKKPLKRKTAQRRADTVSPNRLATLESLSYEIMTSTLPINKMKRILPEERTPVQERWPILSNYRKQNLLPSVKRGKKKLTHDMSQLHTKINQYFDCDDFPLWQYKYVPKQQPRKYRLLKAIETEPLNLPIIPKHD